MGQVPTKKHKPLKNKLLRAVRTSDIVTIETILSSGKINVNRVRDHKGSPLLCVAVRRGNPDVIAMLLKSQQSICETWPTGKHSENSSSKTDTYLRNNSQVFFPVAVNTDMCKSSEDVTEISCMASECDCSYMDKVDVDVTDKNGMSPIHITAVNGHRAVTQLLIDHGADVNKEDALKAFPLHAASAYAHTDVCQLLIAHGAVLNCVEKSGLTPLHLGVITGGIEVVRMLLRAGAWPDVPDFEGRSPLHFASVLTAYRGLDDIVRTDRSVVLCLLLLHYGGDISFADDSNCSPLLYACLKNNRQLIRLFLDYHMLLVQKELKKLEHKQPEGYQSYLREKSLLDTTCKVVRLTRLCRKSLMGHVVSVRQDVTSDTQLFSLTNDLELPRTLINFLKYKE